MNECVRVCVSVCMYTYMDVYMQVFGHSFDNETDTHFMKQFLYLIKMLKFVSYTLKKHVNQGFF